MTFHIPEREISPPETPDLPDGLTVFTEINNKAANECFIDELEDLMIDRDWWLAALRHSLLPLPDEQRLGRMLRLKLIEIATRAGESLRAQEVWEDEYR